MDLVSRCLICGANNSTSSLEVGSELSLTKCGVCLGISSSRVPSAEELERAYMRFSAGEIARENFDTYFSLAKAILSTDLGRAGGVIAPNAAMLDYGCGAGHFVAAGAALGFNAEGIELDSASVAAARSRGLKVVQGRLPDNANLISGQFQVIKCMHVMEHVPEPRVLLGEFFRLLTPGGLLLLSVPDQLSFPSRFKIFLRILGIKRGEFGFVQPPIHLHGFTLETLEIAATACGFEVLWIDRTGPLDSNVFPTAPGYWKGIQIQKWVYRLGKLFRSSGHLSACFRKR